jgi:hypothetical protein
MTSHVCPSSQIVAWAQKLQQHAGKQKLQWVRRQLRRTGRALNGVPFWLEAEDCRDKLQSKMKRFVLKSDFSQKRKTKKNNAHTTVFVSNRPRITSNQISAKFSFQALAFIMMLHLWPQFLLHGMEAEGRARWVLRRKI